METSVAKRKDDSITNYTYSIAHNLMTILDSRMRRYSAGDVWDACTRHVLIEEMVKYLKPILQGVKRESKSSRD